MSREPVRTYMMESAKMLGQAMQAVDNSERRNSDYHGERAMSEMQRTKLAMCDIITISEERMAAVANRVDALFGRMFGPEVFPEAVNTLNQPKPVPSASFERANDSLSNIERMFNRAMERIDRIDMSV